MSGEQLSRRLIELDPRWFTMNNIGEGVTFIIGLTFLCPCCQKTRLAVPFANPIDPQGWLHRGIQWPHIGWNRQGETFDTLTITPSIDVSPHGHWHGFITNGDVQ